MFAIHKTLILNYHVEKLFTFPFSHKINLSLIEIVKNTIKRTRVRVHDIISQ